MITNSTQPKILWELSNGDFWLLSLESIKKPSSFPVWYYTITNETRKSFVRSGATLAQAYELLKYMGVTVKDEVEV